MKNYLFLLMLLLPFSSFAQDSNFGNWIIYFGNKKMASKHGFRVRLKLSRECAPMRHPGVPEIRGNTVRGPQVSGTKGWRPGALIAS